MPSATQGRDVWVLQDPGSGHPGGVPRGIKNDKSYCFKIQGADQRNACLAREKGDRGYCFKIQSKDLQKDCLANTPR